jgi:hypothetical protein
VEVLPEIPPFEVDISQLPQPEKALAGKNSKKRRAAKAKASRDLVREAYDDLDKMIDACKTAQKKLKPLLKK